MSNLSLKFKKDDALLRSRKNGLRDIADETKKLGDRHFRIQDTLYSNIENLRSSLSPSCKLYEQEAGL